LIGTKHEAGQGVDRGIVWAAAAVATVALALWARHAIGYFFLFDDFAIVGQATQYSLDQIVTTPLLFFYRPFVFLFVRLEAVAFGWAHPAGYLLVNLLVHAGNAALVAALAWRLFGSRAGAATAGALFLLSTWSSEAVFWMSGAFDLWATAGTLVVLNVIVRTAVADPARAWPASVAIPLVVLAGAVALFAKESAVTLVVLGPLVVLAGRDAVSWRRLMPIVGILLVMTGVYLALRSRALSTLGGAYGDWWTLIRGASVGRNLYSYAHAIALPPVAHDVAWKIVGTARVTGPVAVAGLLLLLGAACLRVRQLLPIVAALAISIVPVVWLGMSAMSSASGRVLYQPGVFVALWCGIGVVSLAAHAGRLARPALLVACGAVAVHHLTSLDAQRRHWTHATRLARSSIEQFRPYVGRAGHIHVTNLPFWFEEGPFVLKSAAFGYYYHPRPVPDVSAMTLSLAVVDGKVKILTRTPEIAIASRPSGEGTPFTLALDAK
jgi:hypothetical protein